MEGQDEANLECGSTARVKCVEVPLDSESRKKGAKTSHNYINSTFQRQWLMDHLLGLPPPVSAASSGSANAERRRAAAGRPPPPPPAAGARRRAEQRGTASAAAPRGSPRRASARRSRSRDDLGP